MILPRWFHPCGLKMSSKDDSSPLISSLRIKILFQRWFFPADFIPAEKNPFPEMILLSWFHPCRQKSSSWDYSSLLISSLRIKILFQRWFFCWFYPCFVINASLRGYFVEWGWIPWGEVIPGRTACKIQMHSQLRSHSGPGGLQI